MKDHEKLYKKMVSKGTLHFVWAILQEKRLYLYWPYLMEAPEEADVALAVQNSHDFCWPERHPLPLLGKD